MSKCIGCEVFPKCTAQGYGDVTCRYLRFSYGMDDRTEMTNADRIRAMSDEELGEFLIGVYIQDYWDNPNDIVEWLQQPAEEVHKDA